MSRRVTGHAYLVSCGGNQNAPEPVGVFYAPNENISVVGYASSALGRRLGFDSGRQVPVGNANKVRSWGALACVYLGAPR